MRRFGPLAEGHPVVGSRCGACEEPFARGDYLALRPLPPDDPEEREKMTAGRAYTTAALPVHWACLTREEQGS